jgi:signal transduction histidine kinase
MARGLAGELTESQQDIINRIEARLDHLQGLINDLLALAASKTPDLQDPATRLPLQSSLKSCVERWRPQAEEKNITLTYSGPPEILAVRGTEEGLCRIFDNLIGNAVKYTPAGGTVTVRGVERMGNVVITVADTGIGIPAEDLPKLWEEFYRASNARGSSIPGTGLGLSIVKRLVEAMGGTVGVRSEEGVGTTFKVTLPVLGPGDSI